MDTIKIAIDGPAGAGKTTISRSIASKFGFVYVDTGAMYRAVALKAKRAGLDLTSPEEIDSMMEDTTLDIIHENGEQRILLDGVDVSGDIRDPEISMLASSISAFYQVRHKLVQMQRDLAHKYNVVMDGRDISSFVLPHADLKFFLTATLEDRAIRRFEELKGRNTDLRFDDVKKEMKHRDKNDAMRECSPLMLVADAIVIDTSDNTLDQSIEIVETIVREKLINAL